MDPNKVLRHLRTKWLKEDLEAVYTVAEAAQDLDKWLMKGGFLPKEWAEKCNGGFVDRALLAKSVYEAWASSFDDGRVEGAGPTHILIGNLVGALLCGKPFMLPKHPPSMREEFLSLFEEDHPVWSHVTREEDVDG